jgi:hypothetical protein
MTNDHLPILQRLGIDVQEGNFVLEKEDEWRAIGVRHLNLEDLKGNNKVWRRAWHRGAHCLTVGHLPQARKDGRRGWDHDMDDPTTG